MGTLTEQLPRRNRTVVPGRNIAELVLEISKEFDISKELAFKCIELEYKIDDYDSKDEQLAGFGIIFSDLASSIERISTVYENLSN